MTFMTCLRGLDIEELRQATVTRSDGRPNRPDRILKAINTYEVLRLIHSLYHASCHQYEKKDTVTGPKTWQSFWQTIKDWRLENLQDRGKTWESDWDWEFQSIRSGSERWMPQGTHVSKCRKVASGQARLPPIGGTSGSLSKVLQTWRRLGDCAHVMFPPIQLWWQTRALDHLC